MSRKRKRRESGFELNITALMDVAFILLFVFIMIAPAMQSGIEINLPETGGKALEVPEKQVYVSINAAKEIYINDALLGTQEMRSALVNAGAKPDMPVYVRGDEGADYGFVLKTLAKINSAGFSKVNLISNQENS